MNKRLQRHGFFIHLLTDNGIDAKVEDIISVCEFNNCTKVIYRLNGEIKEYIERLPEYKG